MNSESSAEQTDDDTTGDDTADDSNRPADEDVESKFTLTTPDTFNVVEYRTFTINGVTFDERDLSLLQALASDRTDTLDVIDPTQDQQERLREAEIVQSTNKLTPTSTWKKQGRDVLRSLQSAMMKKPQASTNWTVYLLIASVFLLGILAAFLIPSLSTL